MHSNKAPQDEGNVMFAPTAQGMGCVPLTRRRRASLGEAKYHARRAYHVPRKRNTSLKKAPFVRRQKTLFLASPPHCISKPLFPFSRAYSARDCRMVSAPSLSFQSSYGKMAFTKGSISVFRWFTCRPYRRPCSLRPFQSKG